MRTSKYTIIIIKEKRDKNFQIKPLSMPKQKLEKTKGK